MNAVVGCGLPPFVVVPPLEVLLPLPLHPLHQQEKGRQRAPDRSVLNLRIVSKYPRGSGISPFLGEYHDDCDILERLLGNTHNPEAPHATNGYTSEQVAAHIAVSMEADTTHFNVFSKWAFLGEPDGAELA